MSRLHIPRGQGKNPRPDPGDVPIQGERLTGSPDALRTNTYKELVTKARDCADAAEQQLADLDKQEAPMSAWSMQKHQLQLSLANTQAALAVYYETRAARYAG